MSSIRPDPVLAVAGCVFLVLTGFAVRDALTALRRLKETGRADPATVRRTVAIRVLATALAVSGVTFAATVSFDYSIHGGVSRSTQGFRDAVGTVNVISALVWLSCGCGLAWAAKGLKADGRGTPDAHHDRDAARRGP